MVDQFGVTLHGEKNPIKYAKREDFCEPRIISYVPKQLSPQHRAWNFPKGLDVYDLVLDGYSYSSHHLLQQIKRKKFTKPFDFWNTFVELTSSVTCRYRKMSKDGNMWHNRVELENKLVLDHLKPGVEINQFHKKTIDCCWLDLHWLTGSLNSQRHSVAFV